MSSARLPRKQRKEVLSQSSEHARSVRRDTRPQQIKGRRAFDAEGERRPQSVRPRATRSELCNAAAR